MGYNRPILMEWGIANNMYCLYDLSVKFDLPLTNMMTTMMIAAAWGRQQLVMYVFCSVFAFIRKRNAQISFRSNAMQYKSD